MTDRVWGFAERMEFNRRWPLPFWRWLLRKCDRAHGHYT